jgi:hypothetical protein
MYTEFRTSFYPEAAVFWVEHGKKYTIGCQNWNPPTFSKKKKKQPAKDGSIELIGKIIK